MRQRRTVIFINQHEFFTMMNGETMEVMFGRINNLLNRLMSLDRATLKA